MKKKKLTKPELRRVNSATYTTRYLDNIDRIEKTGGLLTRGEIVKLFKKVASKRWARQAPTIWGAFGIYCGVNIRIWIRF